MATNKWTVVELYGQNGDGCPRSYAIGNGVAVSRGDVLALIDPRTASAAIAAVTTMTAGVAAMEKMAGDGKLFISCWTDGIFDAVCSGAVSLGSPIYYEGVNQIASNALTTAAGVGSAAYLGYALEEGANAEVINVRLKK